MAGPVTALVQGASRGLGLQFCRSLLSRQQPTSVIATCRSPSDAVELRQLQQDPGTGSRLHVLQVDVTDEVQIKAAADFVRDHQGGLDLLINCAGILHPSGRGETSLKDVTLQGLQTTCATNAFGPLLMGKHFGPLLSRGQGQFGLQSADDKQKHKGVMVNISAKVGSITDNGLGGWYAYRMSKAALNMATKNLSLELGRSRDGRVLCVALHPGTVDTALSRPYHRGVPNLFSAEQSVTKLLAVVEGLTVEDTGRFYTYDKQLLPF